MSSEPCVRAVGLGKKFELYDRPWRRLAGAVLGRGGGRDYWAIRDVDLDLRRGDCVGIIGRNGAGKSTLLSLVCGIMRPTEGTVETRGRIAALLELGAGFKPEFTGRENVSLAAALYGLNYSQIEQRFPAIEEFAGIGEFIDRPVREYSSGMFARLAFAVCAHVDADILVVDEILGVGDVQFQQRSMRFLRKFREHGIVLFVSHNEQAVAALCRSAIWIDRGRVAAAGSTKDVLNSYHREMARLAGPGGGFFASDIRPQGRALQYADPASEARTGAPFDPDDVIEARGGARIEQAALAAADGRPISALRGGETLTFHVSCRALQRLARPRAFFVLRNPFGQIVFAGDSAGVEGTPSLEAGEEAEFDFVFRLPYLPTGNYPTTVFLLSREQDEDLCCDRRDAGIVQVLSQHISSGLANVSMERTLLLAGAEVP